MLGKKIKLLTITLLTLLSTVSLSAAKNVSYNATVCGDAAYLFGCTAYATSGSPSETYGDSTVTVHLLFALPKHVGYEGTISPGQAYLFGCNPYATDGTTVDETYPSAAGCDSTVTFKLKVQTPPMPVHVEYSTTIDQGQAYLFDCDVYDTDGDHDAVYGDSTVTVHLTVTPVQPVHVEYSTAIDQGQAYLFDCDVYDTDGDHDAVYGDSTVTVHLTVLPTPQEDVHVQYSSTITTEENYLFLCEVLHFDEPGPQTITRTIPRVGVAGDSIITLNLTVEAGGAGRYFEYDATIDQGQAYLFSCGAYETDGDYSEFYGDSIITVHLTVNPVQPVHVEYSTTIEHNQAYLFDCGVYDTDGDYDAVYGDSTVTVHLTVSQCTEIIKDTIAYVCLADLPFVWHGHQLFRDTTNCNDTLKTVIGCDSIVRLQLTVLPAPTNEEETVYACVLPITWRDKDYDAYGTYKDPESYKDPDKGCDSVNHVLHLLQYDDPTDEEETMSPCVLPITWRGIECTEYKDYTVTEQYKGSTCDSVNHILHLTKPEPLKGDTAATICDAESFTWHGHILTTDTVISDTIFGGSSLNCDSVITLTLKLYPASVEDKDTVEVCTLPYTWRGQELNEYGDHHDLELWPGSECVKIEYSLHLAKPEAIVTEEVKFACEADLPFVWHGHSLLRDTTNCDDTLKTVAGCDSIVRLTLTVDRVQDSIENVTMCLGESYTWKVDGKEIGTYDAAGTHEHTLLNVRGCDSLHITLNLAVNNPKPAEEVKDTVCDGYAYDWVIDGQIVGTYTEAGDYTYVSKYSTPSFSGEQCDSVTFTLHLFVDTIADDNIHRLPDTVIYNGYTFEWRDHKEYVITQDTLFKYYIKNERGCDSALYSQNVIYNSYIARAEVDVEDVSCLGDTYHGRVSNIVVASDTAWTDSVRVWVKGAPVDSIYHFTVYVLELPKQLPATLMDSLRAICGMRIDSTIAAVEKDIQDYVATDLHLEANTIQWFVKKGGQFAPMVGSDIITGAMESVDVRCVVADRCGHEVALEKTLPVEDPAPHKGATLNGKYGHWLIVLHVNNLLKEQLQFTEEDIDWYQEVDGVETKLDYHGYYYTVDKEMIGKFRVVIHAQSASGCNETIESNTIDWSTPYRAALKLVPNIGNEGTNMRLLNLDPEKEYIVYAYDEAGALIYRTTVSGQAILDFKAIGRQGLYMLRVDSGDKSETLRYIIK